MTREEKILSLHREVRVHAKRLGRALQIHGISEDLEQVGWCGATQAVDRFDPGRGLKLKTLASHRIRGAMLDWLKSGANDPQVRKVARGGRQGERMPDVRVFTAGLFQLDDQPYA